MQTLRCLYIDDEKDRHSRYRSWFERAWRSEYPTIPIEIRVLESADDAIYELQNDASRYDLIIVDIVYGKIEQEKLGFAVIEQARMSDSLAIIAFSAHDSLGSIALTRGADAFLSKQGLLDGKIELPDIAEQFTAALRAKKRFNLTPEIEVRATPNDWQLTSLLLDVGHRNVIEFARQVVDRSIVSIEVKHLKSGWSGAIVMRVNVEVSVPASQPRQERSVLLKVARDYRALSQELEKYRETEYFPTQLFVSIGKEEVLQSEEWYALGIKFLDASHTLLDWLLSAAPSAEIVESTCSQLFGAGGLSELYRKAVHDPNISFTQVSTPHFHPQRIALIEDALRELHPLCSRHDPEKCFTPDLIRSYIQSKRVADIDEEHLPYGAYITRCHGDLHGRNILITQHGRPVLIDPANVGTGHWTKDIARFIVDLFLAGWDSGVHEHEWADMNSWQKNGKAIILGERISELGEKNRQVYTAVRWVRANLPSIVPAGALPTAEWELVLAMAAELMRAGFRVDLPMPKRVLGLTLSGWALQEAARLAGEQLG